MKPNPLLAVTNAFLLGAIAIVGSACEESAAKSRDTASVNAQTQSELSQPAKESLNRVLAAYEQLRAQLARDDILATTGTAQTLDREAREVSASVPQKLRPHLLKLARAAQRLKEMPKQDAAEVRRAFGQVSEPVVTVLVAEPSLQSGRYLFECPMAQGYKKWVQSSARMANPYMGTRMLECGSPSKWKT